MKKVSVAVLSVAALLSCMAVACFAESKVLVAYFSTSGHTEKVAEYIADALGADKFAITPAQPYDVEVDLSSAAKRDANSRVSLEDKDDGARPAITGAVDDMGKYDIVFLGHPIWFGKAPKVVRTFLEAHDLAGKTIVTFCTSGSSEIGDSSQELRSSFDSSAKLLVGRTFRNAPREEVVKWINSLELGLDAK